MGKLFRVFFSSTFSDFVDERNVLHKHVFPKLKELCATYGARFQPIDLRWGIPDEVAVQQSTMQICLDEIRRCQEHTPRPNFLVFLGERYGWTPPPLKIPKTEFDQISPYISKNDIVEIKKWYRHDENELFRLDDGSLTTVYELQPRSKDFEEYEIWEPIEIRLHSILLHAAQKANLSESEMMKYLASATHQEIIEGALNVQDANTHVHCFFRKLTGIPIEQSGTYQDTSPEKIQHLSNLKDKLRNHLPSTIHEYNVDFGNEQEKADYLKNFCEQVHKSLENTITEELNALEDVSAQEEEIQAHLEFAKQRTKVFVGREDIIQKIMEYIENDSRIPIVVYGKPGSGKSALIAQVFERLQKENADADSIVRFVGTSTFSSDSVALLRSVCEEIIKKFDIERENEIPFEYNQLIVTFIEMLNSIQTNKRLVLLIDAIDQFTKSDRGRDISWLSSQLPNNVKIITSYATDDVELDSIVRKKLPNSLFELKLLTPAEGDQILDILFHNANRRLTPTQRELVLSMFNENGLPLYLKLAFEEAIHWNSYDKFEDLTLSFNVHGIIQNLLEQLYSNHTKVIVDRILSFIVAARNGLTEDEIIEVLTSDSGFFEWYTTEQIYHTLPEKKIPWIIWSRLLSDLEPYIAKRSVDKTTVISFFHRQFSEYITKKMLEEESIHDFYHRILANYFESKSTFFKRNNKRIPNYRKLSEWNFHLFKTKSWDILENNLTNLEYIDGKCMADMTLDLQNEFLQFLLAIEENLPTDLYNKYDSNVREFQRFFLNQAHIFRKDYSNFPQLMGQQAINQAINSRLSQLGSQYLKSLHPSLPWFEWKNKVQNDPCILTIITGHSELVNCYVISPDGSKILSASTDSTMKLWDSKTGRELKTFSGHTGSISSCVFSSDSSYILSASYDEAENLKLWDVETGEVIQTYIGHTDGVRSCDFSPDGSTIISFSYDKSLKIWDANSGDVIHTLWGHGVDIECCDYSPNGDMILSADYKSIKIWDVNTGKQIRVINIENDSILTCSFSPDGRTIISGMLYDVLKLWDVQTGENIRTFEGHTDRIYCVSFSSDGKTLVSGSEDCEVKTWNSQTGEIIRTFSGHTSWIISCAFFPDDKTILSGSYNGTMKLWNNESEDVFNTFTGNTESVNCCVFSKDGTSLLSGSQIGAVDLWNVETGVKLHSYKGHKYAIFSCAISPDDNFVLAGDADGSIIIWNKETEEILRKIQAHESCALNTFPCGFVSDGTMIFSVGSDKVKSDRVLRNTLKLWNAVTGTLIKTFNIHEEIPIVNFCIFSSDGRYILTNGEDWDDNFLMVLWDSQTGEKLRTFSGHLEEIEYSVFSPNGQRILSGSRDKTMKLWDLESGEVIRTYSGNDDGISSCLFSQDGNFIISGSYHTLTLWDANTGEQLMIFQTIGIIKTISMTKDNLIAVGDTRGNLYLLKIHLGRTHYSHL